MSQCHHRPPNQELARQVSVSPRCRTITSWSTKKSSSRVVIIEVGCDSCAGPDDRVGSDLHIVDNRGARPENCTSPYLAVTARRLKSRTAYEQVAELEISFNRYPKL